MSCNLCLLSTHIKCSEIVLHEIDFISHHMVCKSKAKVPRSCIVSYSLSNFGFSKLTKIWNIILPLLLDWLLSNKRNIIINAYYIHVLDQCIAIRCTQVSQWEVGQKLITLFDEDRARVNKDVIKFIRITLELCKEERQIFV